MLTTLAALLLLSPSPAAAAAIDLHVHLRMDASLPGLFQGYPTELLSPVKERTSIFKNQVSLTDMEKANVRLVMSSLYAAPVLSWAQGGHFAALNRQIDILEDWLSQHPQVSLVRTPAEAEAILKSKEWRLGIILAVEGTYGVDTPERLEKLMARGLRMAAVTHFIDGPWAGAAAVRYFPFPDCKPGGKDPGKRNPKGLLPKGRQLADLAVSKGLILDLTHSSDRTVGDVAERFPGLPLMFSHQAAREYTPCERTLSPELLRLVKKTDGLVGLTFVANYTGDKLEDLARHAAALAREAGPQRIALGSDYNGMAPRVEGAATSAGYSVVLEALRKEKVPAHLSAETFVAFWKRTLDYPSAARSKSPRP